MAPAYKLTYFPIEALAEPTRFLLSYGNIEFIDERCDPADWPELKPKLPFGQIPVLEYNGKLTHQSVAIARYFAKQVKLVGDNDWEALEIDSAVETVNDLRQKIADYHYEENEAVKVTKKPPLVKETLPFYLERLDAIVKLNNGYLATGKLTWADFYFIGLLKYLSFMVGTDIIANYPNLVQLKKTVENIPAIKTWIEKRPKTNR